MFMDKQAENPALALEPLFASLSHQRDVQELDRNTPLKSSVDAFRKPYASHPTLTDLRTQPVNAKRLPLQSRGRRWQFDGSLIKESRGRQIVVFAQQCLQSLSGLGRLLAHPDRTFLVVKLKGLVKKGAQLLPLA